MGTVNTGHNCSLKQKKYGKINEVTDFLNSTLEKISNETDN